ncbi:hypothetical protein [Winogradskya humida]|uniref:Uncharacterized protein n=1 Tax=Winogradskya humida TaxID=113566 RepID=A0ABQ4A1N7_9ACTN|nr:hypothetical protein [Actinoplanes humidus]GIE24761.1 hypothetical protein Ahu01nite_078630 [Actinoplanes humidus]
MTSAISVVAVLILTGQVAGLVAAYLRGGRPAPWDGTVGLVLGVVLFGALPLLLVTGLVRQRLAYATIGEVLARVRDLPAGELEATISRATGDTRVLIAHLAHDGWRDTSGRPCTLPDATSGLAVTTIGTPPRAALVHTPSLAAEPGLLGSVLSLVGLAFTDHDTGEQEPVPYAFISYLREDSAEVDRLVAALRAHGVEELRLRLRPRDRRWFLPVRLGPCEIPALELGAGETLEDLHAVDLAEDWDAAVQQLVRAIRGADRPA